jgi:predicted CXXCH cytochrome family protein
MKRFLAALIVLAVGVLSAAGASAYTGSYVPGDGINASPHDLSRTDTGMNYVAVPADPLNRICIFCHAPHNTYRLSTATGGAGPLAPPEFDYLPLWNHTLQDPTGYVMYDNGPGAPQTGPKASQAIQNGMVPGSTSLLCLSCHDGTIAVNSYGNVDQRTGSQSTGTSFMAASYQIGKDKYLGNHHPVGFDYDLVYAADTEIRSPDATQLTPTSLVRDHLYGPGNALLECASCHSVHNKGNSGEVLLWRSDQNSELCLTCHDKGIYTAP